MAKYKLNLRSICKPSTQAIGGHRCIELRTVCLGHENVEYGLSGKNGEIWEESIGENGLHKDGETPRYKAIVLSGPSTKRGRQEQLVRFGATELDAWVLKLEVPADPRDQTPFANTFGKR